MTPTALETLRQHLIGALDAAPDEARRLFHGRGRCWPELEQITVDWLQGIVLVVLYREPASEQLQALQALQAMLLAFAQSPEWQRRGAHTLLLQHRYRPDSPCDWLVGEPREQWPVSEHGLRYLLDLGRKQNSGLFLDMRLGRCWVREHAAQQRVLNLFAYTCAFSVAALAGGARHVVNLDMASAALARGRENHRLNGQALSQVSFLAHDLLKSWGRVRKLGPYDLVIIDPPSFQKGSFALGRDYAKVLRRLPELVAPRGQVLACINDPEVAPGFLIDCMQAEAPAFEFQERLANPPEFPDISADSGLKALVFCRRD